MTRLARLAFLAASLIAIPTQAQEETPAVPGIGPSGLPGLFRVGVAGTDEPSLSVAATGGYGLTEAQEGEDGSHHRIAGILALGVTPTEWLGLALRLDGRYDTHPDDAMGADDGLIGAPSLLVRAGSSFGGVRLGVELGVTVPGEDAPSIAFDALVLDASALAAYAPEGSPVAVAARVGYRLDNSASAIEQPQSLRPGDRLAIGLSEFDALLLGLGLSYRAAAVEVIGEFTWDLLLGDGAPGATEAPMHVTVGGRYHASDSISIVLAADVSPSSRPSNLTAADAPLFPIDPRFAVWAGLRWTMPLNPPPPVVIADVEEQPDEEQPDDEQQPDEQPVEPPVETPQLPPGQIRGLVRDFGGQPLQASVVVQRVAAEGETPAEPVTAQTDADGLFEVDVQPGSYEVTIEAPGYTTQQRTVTVEEQGVTVLNADLRRGGG